jgi:hypothetical protein
MRKYQALIPECVGTWVENGEYCKQCDREDLCYCITMNKMEEKE